MTDLLSQLSRKVDGADRFRVGGAVAGVLGAPGKGSAGPCIQLFDWATGKTAHTITDSASLLRELATVRRRGYAVDDEEDAEGVFCVGSAVADHGGHCVGAISVTGLKLDLPPWRIEQLGQTVRDHAARISAELGAPAVSEAVV